MRFGYLISSFVLALAVAGCSNTGGQSSFLNSFVPQSTGKSSVIDALNGGIIDPSVSAQLSSEDRMKALEAEYRALEIAPSGQIVAWQGAQSGVSGEVFAAQPYEVGSQNCRQYVHKVVQDGVTTTARGTACRSEDGNWTPLV
ncbi:RT0821/Lpp0805 family surface protein [Nitratireductor sp. XY-223]|uniref:RT0821/Lpp0805 family surface protein n=1 Tax=Nitratireductor sp. XY-223 TaxID=2561926 RepID=UPI0010AB0320|nr:RT0821/Lpp0805 family surface protein [Nitratireductor sp. XY-223]